MCVHRSRKDRAWMRDRCWIGKNSSMIMSTRTVRECSLEDVASVREPGVIRGVEIGKASSLWKQPSYLAKRCSSRQVRVHASPTPRMDFISKNFSYKWAPAAAWLLWAPAAVQLLWLSMHIINYCNLCTLSSRTLSFDEFIELASTEHQQYSGSAAEVSMLINLPLSLSMANSAHIYQVH